MFANKWMNNLRWAFFVVISCLIIVSIADARENAMTKAQMIKAPTIEAPNIKQRAVVTMENASISLDFDIDNDMRLSSVEEVASGALFTFKDKPIWRLTLREVATGIISYVSPVTHAYTFNHTFNDYGTYKELVAVWSGITISASNTIDSVTVTATLDNNDIVAEMHIEVATDLADHSLFRIYFPEFYIEAIGATGDDDMFAYPQHGGYVIDDPIDNLKTLGFPGPGWWSMQYFCYYDDSGLLYLGTDDEEGYLKIYGMFGSPADDAVYWRIDHYPEDHIFPGVVTYSAPYNFKIGAMEGDWFDASAYYRDWALGRIVTRPRIDDPNTNFPSNLLDIDGICAFNCGKPTIGLTADMLQGHLDCKDYYGVDKVVTVVYLWTNEPGTWAMWPDVTPYHNIEAGIQSLHSYNEVVFVYTQINCNINAPSYVNNNWVDWAIKDLDGNPYIVGDLVTMDGSTEFWQNHVRDWNVTYTQMLDFDGVFWDYWSGFNLTDYDPGHGHPLGGGKYCVQGKIQEATKTLNAVRALPGKEDWFITSEYLNEFYCDLTAIEMWNHEFWNETIGQMPKIRLPMYEVVYGDRQMAYVVSQTHIIGEPMYENLMSYVFGSRYSEGMGLGWVCTAGDPFHPGTSPYGEVAYQFLGKLLRTYEFARKYLLWGQRMREPHVHSVNSTNYYDLHTMPTHEYDNHYIYTPSFPDISRVLPSVWRSKADNLTTHAIVLVNWSDTQETINYTFKFDDYDLTKGRHYHVKEFSEDGITLLDTVTDDFTRDDTLSARDVKILVVQPMLQPKPVGGSLTPQ